MRLLNVFNQADAAADRPAPPSTVETAQRWHDVGGIEGVSLEWMLDRNRAPQEARP